MPPLDPIALTQTLVRMASVTPACPEILDAAQGVLEGLGAQCRRLLLGPEGAQVDNLYATVGGGGSDGGGGPTLLFCGHLDVVPPGPGWSRDPFSGAIEGGRLHGRGSADMKSGVAAFIAALSAVLARGELERSGGRVALLLTGDEEGPAEHGVREALKVLAAEGETWDGCLTGEPTSQQHLGDAMKPGRRGNTHITLTLRGVQGHTGYPGLAHNAAHDVTRCLNALLDMTLDVGSAHFEPSDLQITHLAIEEPASNIIPGAATAQFSVRFNDQHTEESLLSLLGRTLDGVAAGRWSWSVRTTAHPFLTESSPLMESIIQGCQRITGRTPRGITEGGTSDSRFIKDYCPVVDFGLVGSSMHQLDESVSVEEIVGLQSIYEYIIEDFTGTER